MADDLQELGERLDWCENQLKSCKSDIGNFYDNSVETDQKVTDDGLAVYIRMGASIPVSFRSNYGCILNETRATLDALANCLARRNGVTKDKASFPISKNEESLNKDVREKLVGVSKTDKLKIIELKPYGGGDDLLRKLHDLDIQRKHIALLPTFASTPRVDIYGGSVSFKSLIGIGPLSSEWQRIAVIASAKNAALRFVPETIVQSPSGYSDADALRLAEEFILRVRAVLATFSQSGRVP